MTFLEMLRVGAEDNLDALYRLRLNASNAVSSPQRTKQMRNTSRQWINLSLFSGRRRLVLFVAMMAFSFEIKCINGSCNR